MRSMNKHNWNLNILIVKQEYGTNGSSTHKGKMT